MTSERDGVAVVAAVLVLIVATLLAHGALTLARLQEASARTGAALLQAQALASRGLDRERVSVNPLPDSLPAGRWASGAAGRARTGTYVVERRRLDSERWLLRSVGLTRRGGGVRAVRWRLVWVMDPVMRAAAAPAVVVSAPGARWEIRGKVEGLAARDPWRSDPLCRPFRAALDSLASPSLPSTATLPAGEPLVSLGLLDEGAMLTNALPVSGAVETLVTPPEDADCAPGDPGGWGDPENPRGSCHGRMAVHVRDGDLTLRGGSGQGVLVVRGDLTLGPGVGFYGLAFVEGTLLVTSHAALYGLVRTGGGTVVESGGTVARSDCAVAAVLAAVPSWRRPVTVPGGRLVGP
ncbi:MAG: hypothetical protein ACE5GJ_01850 [Gemmatimonadota bacterium]